MVKKKAKAKPKKKAKSKSKKKAKSKSKKFALPVIEGFITPEEVEYENSLINDVTKDQHREFVEEYLIRPNGKTAAIRVGYTEKNAADTAHSILNRPEIKKVLELGFKAQRARGRVTREKIEAEYAKLAFSNIKNYLSFGPSGISVKDSSEMSDDMLAAIAEVSETVTIHGGSFKLKMSDKKMALDSLSRMHGLFKDSKLDLSDPVKQLLEHIAGNGTGLTVK